MIAWLRAQVVMTLGGPVVEEADRHSQGVPTVPDALCGSSAVEHDGGRPDQDGNGGEPLLTMSFHPAAGAHRYGR